MHEPSDRGRFAFGMINDLYKRQEQGRWWVEKKRRADFGAYGQNARTEQIVRRLFDRLSTFRFVELSVASDGAQLFEYIEACPERLVVDEALLTIPQVLSEIHAVKSDRFGDLDAEGSAASSEYFSKLLLKELTSPWMMASGFAARYREFILSRLASFCERNSSPCLVHGDFHPGNILVTAAGQLYLIDWEASRYRTPHFDFVQLNFLSSRNRSDVFSAVAKKYCDLNGIPCEGFIGDVEWLTTYWAVRTLNFLSEHGDSVVADAGYAHALLDWVTRRLSLEPLRDAVPSPHALALH